MCLIPDLDSPRRSLVSRKEELIGIRGRISRGRKYKKVDPRLILAQIKHYVEFGAIVQDSCAG